MGTGDDQHGHRPDHRLVGLLDYQPGGHRDHSRGHRDVEQEGGGAVGQHLSP